jgi:HKD family nuclease
MELLRKTTTQVTEVEYRFQEENGHVLFYKEWLDDRGKVIDYTLRDKYGGINDPNMLEKVQMRVDELEATNM